MARKRMLIIADENIPFVAEAFEEVGEVRTYSGRQIAPDDVRNADALLVRSVTQVDETLLDGSTVRFVGSATIGTDHVDQGYLAENNIAFAHAPGSNADSVVEYVIAALLWMAARRSVQVEGLTVGIIGCGNIGGRLRRRLPPLGLHVLANDPPLAEAAEARGDTHDFVSIDTLLSKADVVTCHVPLNRSGRHMTKHLIDERVLQRMRQDQWLVNTSRGAVIDNEALLAVLERQEGPGAAVLDVWEGEPAPNPELLQRTDLATPHIAGYSYDGKVQGTIMLYDALVEHLEMEDRWDASSILIAAPDDELEPVPPDPSLPATDWLHRLVRRMYDIAGDDRRMRDILSVQRDEHGAFFTGLRRKYPRRRAFDHHRLPVHRIPPALRRAVADGLQLELTPTRG